MNRWEVITRQDDDEMWEIAETVIEREWLEDGQIRWVIETPGGADTIAESVPSVTSVRPADTQESA